MRFFGSVLFVSLACCGGIVDSPLLDGGGGDGSPGNDGSPSLDGNPAPTCNDLVNELASQEVAATQCCPTCNIAQCTTQVDGLCCPLTVDNGDSDAVKTYEATLAQLKNLKCAVNCPALACSTKPSLQCTQSATCTQ